MKAHNYGFIVAIMCAVFLAGCASFAAPKTLGDNLVYAGHTLAAIKSQAATMLNRGRISVDDAEVIQQRTNEAQSILNLAWSTRSRGDIDAATAALSQAQSIIFEIERLYLSED